MFLIRKEAARKAKVGLRIMNFFELFHEYSICAEIQWVPQCCTRERGNSEKLRGLGQVF